MSINKQQQSGFTLIEALVAMVIFTVVTAMATFSFLQFNDEHRRIRKDSVAQADVLNIIEAISYEVRNGGIDYGFYRLQADETLLQSPQEFLVLRNVDNDQVRYRRIVSGVPGENDVIQVCLCEAEKGDECKAANYCDVNNEWHNMHSRQTNVGALAFYVAPDWDPFNIPTEDADCFSKQFDPAVGLCKAPCAQDELSGSGYCQIANIQPRITMDLQASRGMSVMNVQTQMNTRQYAR